MTEITTVARPYAKAAFEHASAAGQLAGWSDMLERAADVVADAGFKQYIARPTLTVEQQAEAIFAVSDSLDGGMRNFIVQLAENKRLLALPAISAMFQALRADAEGAVDVDVVSAFAMDDAQTQALAAVLSQKLSRQVNVTSSVDATLIGGAVIRAGDTVIDASVRGKLGKLSATLNS